MQTLYDVDGSAELRWIKPRRSRRQFELHAGEAVVATLTRTRGAEAIGQWAGEQYRFGRQGWFRQRIVVHRTPAADAPDPTIAPDALLATFVHRDTLAFADGRTFLWQKPKRWTNERVWVDSAGAVLARFAPGRGQTTVTLASEPRAARSPELPLLLLLGQYLLVLAAQDAEAASTAAVVAVIASS
jgi:hypothetical protein